MKLELNPETEARIVAEAEALGITPEQYASAFIVGYVKALDAGHESPGLEAHRFVCEKFSKR